ncbi:MAG TPA: DUF748 domain-containing protein [Methylomirabilota bacterium]|jgi:uncharacterized protein involved in outer membrane biogenesis
MRRRYVWLVFMAVLVLVVAGLVHAAGGWSEIARRVAINRLHAMTGRPVSIERVELELGRGRVAVHGARVLDRDGASTLATFGRFDVRLHLPSLLRGHIWIRDLTIADSTVNVVRTGPRDFNISDLVASTGDKPRRPLDVTIDHFAVTRGTLTLDDRVIQPQRTWRSERIEIEARDLSTRRGGGTATGSSVTAGSPVNLTMTDVRLHPIHFQASVNLANLDLALARLYTPPDAQLTADRGRLGATVALSMDAREGLRVDGDVRLADAVLVRPGRTEPVVTTPAATLTIKDLAIGTGTVDPGSLRLARLELAGRASLFDRRVSPARRYEVDGLRATAEQVTWPVTTPARIALVSRVPGGGELAVRGTARLQPAAADVRVRLTGTELAPWSQFLPAAGRVTGTAAADLAISARLEGQLSARANGTASLARLAVHDRDRTPATIERIDVSGVAWEYPSKLVVDRVVVRRPSALVERDAGGRLKLMDLLRPDAPPSATGAPASSSARPDATPRAPNATAPTNDATAPDPNATAPTKDAAAPPALDVTVRQVRLEDGAIQWRDAAVKPAAQADIGAIQLVLTDLGWPWRGPTPLRLNARAPGGGTLDARGTVNVAPVAADLRLALRGADIAPYQPYVGYPIKIAGRGSAELQLTLTSADPLTAKVRGRAELTQAAVASETGPIVSVPRAEVVDIAADWPERVRIGSVRVERPMAMVERTADGRMPARDVFVRQGSPSDRATAQASDRAARSDDAPSASVADEPTRPLAVEVGRIVVSRGAARFVDRTVSPAYAEDLSALDVEVANLTTAASTPAKLRLTSKVGPTGAFEVSGTVAAFGGPLAADLDAKLRDFTVARVNPYLERYVAWNARAGRLFLDQRVRVRGDALDARNEVRLVQLRVERAAGDHDEARQRIGLPLGMIVALMKNNRGEITMTLPVGGRLDDPRFEVKEAIWGAVRAIAIKTITLPVSWIGRVHFTRDSKIADITVDPAVFEAGKTAPTAGGREQVGRVVEFLQRMPDSRMVITPVITVGDLDALRQEEARAMIDKDGAPRVFAARFPGREAPASVEAIVAAVAADLEPPEAAAHKLAKDRLAAVRTAIKDAGVDPERVQANKDTEGLEAPEGGRVEFGLTDTLKPKRHLLAELLHKLKTLLASRRS